jgi:hypothetical protein
VYGLKHEIKQNNMKEHVEIFDRCITEELSSLYKSLNFPTKPLYYSGRTGTVAHKIMNISGGICEQFSKIRSVSLAFLTRVVAFVPREFEK